MQREPCLARDGAAREIGLHVTTSVPRRERHVGVERECARAETCARPRERHEPRQIEPARLGAQGELLGPDFEGERGGLAEARQVPVLDAQRGAKTRGADRRARRDALARELERRAEKREGGGRLDTRREVDLRNLRAAQGRGDPRGVDVSVDGCAHVLELRPCGVDVGELDARDDVRIRERTPQVGPNEAPRGARRVGADMRDAALCPARPPCERPGRGCPRHGPAPRRAGPRRSVARAKARAPSRRA
jgi:hypothetical protein